MKISHQLKKIVAMVMVFAIALTIGTFTLLPQTAQAESNLVDLSATRYRYPLLRFESALFRKGVELEENNDASAYLSIDKDKSINGTDDMSLLYARVDDYPDLFDMNLGVNRALRITCSDTTNPAVAELFVGYVNHLGTAVGTNPKILPDSIQGIPSNATDHGIMIHVEFRGLPGKEADGYVHAKVDEDGNITGYNTHVKKDFNITFQEVDYKANGTVNKKRGKEAKAAYNVKAGAELTLIWTKDVSFTNDGTLEEQKLEANGYPVKDDAGNYVYGPVDDYSYKAGDTMIWNTYEYNNDGSKYEGGQIQLPRDFCGYIMIPFSEMQICWEGYDDDGHINLKNLELANIYYSSYWYHQGEFIIDEFCFYGPTFANVNGAYDYGDITFENHKDSMKNRKEIKIEETSKPQEESKPVTPPPAEIQTAVSLKDETTNVVLNAPASANIPAETVLHADVVDVASDDYLTVIYNKLFGSDSSLYHAYSVYLGDDGDVEPEDYCELILPIPDGFDADKCKVYTLEGSDSTNTEKVEATFKLSDDKKSLIVTTMAMTDYIIYVGTADEGNGDATTDEGDGNDTTDDATSAPVADDKTETAGADLTWLWIVLGVIVVGGAVAAVLVLTKKKAADEAPAEEAAAEETTEE